MGDRWTLKLNCVYCNHSNDKVYYAPTCNFYTFKCSKCKKENYIDSNHKANKIEDANLKDIREGFVSNTNGCWSDEEIDKMCRSTLKELRRIKNESD